jgi:hypothetical protein
MLERITFENVFEISKSLILAAMVGNKLQKIGL